MANNNMHKTQTPKNNLAQYNDSIIALKSY